MQKTGRNDPCPCGSGKKFKKCCERKMIGKKFMATKIDTSALKNSSISTFFQNQSNLVKKPEDTSKPIKAKVKPKAEKVEKKEEEKTKKTEEKKDQDGSSDKKN